MYYLKIPVHIQVFATQGHLRTRPITGLFTCYFR